MQQQGALLAFSIATWRLAIPLLGVRRVVPLPLLKVSPGAPRFVEGFFDYQGEPVAAVRLDRLFGLQDEALGVYSPLIILQVEDTTFALHVAQIDTILPADTDVQPIGREETFNSCVVGRVTANGETIYVLSKEEILLAEERAKIAAHSETKRQRLEDLEAQLAHAS